MTDVRYVTEPGIDGSWLVVDRGPDGQRRRAIARHEDHDAATEEAENLSMMDELAAGLPVAGDAFGVSDVIEGLGSAPAETPDEHVNVLNVTGSADAKIICPTFAPQLLSSDGD
jgi:hypothetical protein